jgi:uncharacterized membrane protein YhdT
MKFTNRREIGIIIVVALLATLPILFFTRNLSFHLQSDYDLFLPTLYFLQDIFHDPGKFLFWNPYIGTGIPNLGDLGSTIWSPLYVLPVLFFGVDAGVKAMIILGMLLSGYSMWIFLRSLRVGPMIRIWGACLYTVSGVVGASIAAGHYEKLFAYSLVPLFLTVSIKRKISIKDSVIAACLCTLMMLSAEFNVPYFLFIFYFIIRAYYAITYKNERVRSINSLLLFCIFLGIFFAPKAYFIIKDVAPHFQRFYTSNPYIGSIHAFLLPFLYSMPLQTIFYDRPSVQRFFGFQYNWFEYYAFISPLPFIALFYIKSILKKDETKLFLILIGIGALYIAIKYPYSPFYWLFQMIPVLHIFRVPSRIATPLTSVVIALCAMCLHVWNHAPKNKIQSILLYCVMYGSIVLSFAATQIALLDAFETPRVTEEAIAKELRTSDPSSYYVANFACCMQTFLVKEHIPIINFYYTWRTKDTPSFLNAKENGYNYDVLRTTRPTYVIAYSKDSFERYNYAIQFVKGNITVWKTSSPTILPKL